MLSRLGLLVVILAVLLPFFVSAQTADTVSKPTEDGWKMAKPIEAGLDPAALADLAALINVDATYPNVHALLIEHRGRLVFERYWPGEDYLLRGGSLGVVDHGPKTLHDIRSISKSVISLLLGIALGETAETRLNHPIASLFPDHQAADPRWEQVTLHHVLSMTAGLAWNELLVPYDQRNDFIRLLKHPDPIGYVLAKEVRDPPGKRWNYNSGLTELVGAVIEHLAGRPLEDYAREMLFDPLGITDYTWHRPSAWPADAFPSASAGLRMRARDLAKIGSLVLHQGQWQGRQIVPQSWISVSTTRHVDNRWGRYGYGYFWYPGSDHSGRPVIRASGYGDQAVFVVPDAGLAITVFAGNHTNRIREVDMRILGRILRAVR